MASPKEIADAARKVKEKMLWQKAETIAYKFTVAVLSEWVKLEKSIYEWMPVGMTYETARANSPKKKSDEREKAENENSLSLARQLLTTEMGMEAMMQLERLFDSTFEKLFTGNGGVVDTGAIFNEWYKRTFQEGLNQAYNEGLAAVRRANPETRRWFEKYVGNPYPFDQGSAYAMRLYQDGFKLIKAQVTVQFKAIAMRTIAYGLKNKIAWDQIAGSIHSQIGLGNAAHWQRLVRTEMLNAFDLSSKERYAGMRVNYVRMVLSPNHCQKCADVYNQNSSNGYFKLGGAPSLPSATHTNCRCRFVPVFTLPKSARV